MVLIHVFLGIQIGAVHNGTTPAPRPTAQRASSVRCCYAVPPSAAPQHTPVYQMQHTLHEDVDQILYSETEIQAGIDRVAEEVTRDYMGKEFSVVSILKGSCVFASDLIRRIPIPLELAFVAAESYREGTESGDLKLNFFPSGDEIEGRNILLVDDILDTGKTMFSLRAELTARGAAEVRSCVFLDKPARRAVEYEADYRCFEVEDLFVVGYGLDFAGRYRNLPFVGSLKQSVIAADGAADA